MNNNLIYIVLLFLMTMALVPLARADFSPVNQYDANGSLVNGDGKYYEYNEANQLAKVRENDQNGKVIAEYFYDHTGQRVKKVENGVTTYYIGKHFETQVVEGTAKDTSYFFADGERVARKDSTGTYFYHPDHLGGTNVVTNGAGAVVARNSYLPFGEIREGGQEKYSYTGKEKDKVTDLYYFEARYNHPEFRHFTQADEVEPDYEDPQDLNRYAYVGNNPLSYVDLDGHKKKKKHEKKKKKKKKKDNHKERKGKSNDKEEYVFEEYDEGEYGGECTDLAKAVTTFSGRLGYSYEEKKSLLDNSNKGFRRGERTIKVGDVIVLNQGPYGHVAVVIGEDNWVFKLIESNVKWNKKVSFSTISKNDTRIYGAYDTGLR